QQPAAPIPSPTASRRTMTHKEALRTENAPQPAGPYSQAIVSGDLLFTAGFGPQDPANGEVAESVAEQTRQGLRTRPALLAERGATLDDALSTSVHPAALADRQSEDAHR